MLRNIFKKEPYSVSIHHDMWEGVESPSFIISKKIHKKRNPIVKIESPFKGVFFTINGDKSVEIKRNLPIFKGTFFSVKVTIE